jgi:tetratricopeptide (TPR) repeat protein
LLKQAVSLHQAGRLPEAEKLYEQILAADRTDFSAQYQLALLLYQSRRFPAALRAADAAMALNPDSRDAQVLHSAVALEAGELDQALVSISKVVARSPDDADAWRSRGIILGRLGRHQEGLESFDRVVAAKPGNVVALLYRANALIALKRHTEAVDTFDKILAQNPNVFDAWSNRGLALYELKRFAEALESYDKAIQIRSDLAPVWANRGSVFAALARFDDALSSYEEAIKRDPEHIKARYARALALRTVHRFEDALQCVDDALAVSPNHARLIYLRGWLMCELHRVDEGLAVVRQAAEQELRATAGAKKLNPAYKQFHDAQQRDHLAAQGIALDDGGLHFEKGAKLSGRTVNLANADSAAAEWAKSRPRIVVIDNLLTPEALEQLRRFCWNSTVWHSAYEKGYLGAMPEQGFTCPLLAQIADELRETFPTIVEDHPLRKLWAFKYDSRLSGIGIHADQAAVNVNFWIAPDGANLNPESGGMVIWDVAAPDDWDIETYNGNEGAVREFLARSGAKAVKVPHRANRAVIFDSDLFHETDTIEFNEGYLNRRINVTMLYGRRTYFGS